jgi:hypothetical protein
MSELVLSVGFPYGAPELERAYRKYFTSALLLGIALAYSLVGCYWGGVYFLKVKKAVVVRSTSDIFNQPTLDAAKDFTL